MLPETYVEALEAQTWALAEMLHGARVRRQRDLVAAIRELSAAYVAGQAPRKPRHQLARLLFFTLADLPKIAYPLAELRRSECLPEGPLHLLDVGAGFGALTLGALGALPDTPIETTWMLDADADALSGARELYAATAPLRRAPIGKIHTRVANLAHPRALNQLPNDFSLIFVGNVLTELPETARAPLLDMLLSRLAPDGVLLIIEPALRHTTHALHHLRDTLIAKGKAHVFAPCSHQLPCPLTDGDAWCHEIRVWQHLPPRLRKLAAATGRRRRDLKFSYLTLLPPNTTAHASASSPPQKNAGGDAYRVVGSIQRSKGRREVALCAAGQHLTALRLDRDQSELNRVFARVGRGHFLWLAATKDAEYSSGDREKKAPQAPSRGQGPSLRLRITSDTQVIGLDPSDIDKPGE